MANSKVLGSNRDSRGRFTEGCRPGPGRPARASELQYLRICAESCPPERWRRIVERAAADAEAGDSAARTFLAKFLMPNPEVVSLRRIDEVEKSDDLFGGLI